MLKGHPTVRDFESFLSGSNQRHSSANDALVLRHLLADCDTCKHELAQMGWGGDRLTRLVHLPAGAMDREVSPSGVSESFNYDRAFTVAMASVDALLAELPQPAVDPAEVLAELAAHPTDHQAEFLQTSGFASPQLVNRLVDQSHDLRFSDPAAMLHFASLARQVALQCVAETSGGTVRLADVRALATGQFANALRVNGQLREAAEAGKTAVALLLGGTRDPLLRARIFEQLATVYLGQRKFEDAISLLQEAGQTHRLVGETHALANTLVVEAIARLYSGEAEVATRLLNQAIPLIDQEVDPHLLLAACHNMVRCYIDLDRPEQALALYNEISDLYRELKSDLNQLRASWQEGQLLRDLGHPQAAETALLRARAGFLERGLMFEVALIALDLTSIYIKLGRANDVRQTVEATVPIFRALGIEREEFAAVLQLQQLAGQQQKALELVRYLSNRIQTGARDEVLP